MEQKRSLAVETERLRLRSSEGSPLPVGDALHLVMERVSLPGAEGLEEVVEAVSAEAGLLERAGEIRDLAGRCVASDTVQRAAASGNYWREVPFTVERDGGVSVGRIDLLYRNRGSLVVIDYKTDYVEAPEVERHAGEHYAGQAEVSPKLCNRPRNGVERVVFVFPRAGVEVSLMAPESREGD